MNKVTQITTNNILAENKNLFIKSKTDNTQCSEKVVISNRYSIRCTFNLITCAFNHILFGRIFSHVGVTISITHSKQLKLYILILENDKEKNRCK